MKRVLTALALLFTLTLPGLSHAGSSEAGDAVLPPADVADFAKSVEEDLAARGAYVAIVGRVGRDPASLPDGLRYTHVAYWVYSRISHRDGSTSTGYRVYNLYQLADDPTRSSLVQDSPAEFFAGAHKLDAGIIIPAPALQTKLLKVIGGPDYATLHNPRYAVLANPRSRMFQNCTEHTLDVLVASVYGTADPVRVKANVSAYFEAQPIKVGGLKRMLAPALSGALVTSDHGRQISTATFSTIGRFMQRYDLAQDVYSLVYKPAAKR